MRKPLLCLVLALPAALLGLGLAFRGRSRIPERARAEREIPREKQTERGLPSQDAVDPPPHRREKAEEVAAPSSEEERASLADRVLRGELDDPLPPLKDYYLAALHCGEPDRQIRAVERLDATDSKIAEVLVSMVLGSARVDVRYAAYRALLYAGREGVIDDASRAALFSEYERFPRA